MQPFFSRTLFFLLVVFAACSASTQAVAGDRRIALIIGNSAYQHTAVLNNPRNDAADFASALRRLNFEVIEGIDLDKRAMERIIRQFGLKLAGADIALFIYAGHGLQVSGQNYLLPIDARLSGEGDVDFESIALHLVLKQMEREVKTSLVLLDACRDNPLARNLARTMGTRSGQISQGLAEVKTGVGTLIGFSTQPGNVAQDGVGRNSPYAAALLKYVETPGQDIGSTLISVRTEVVKATSGRQVPWEHTSLMGQVVLAPAAPPDAHAPNYDKQMEIAFWNAIKDSKSPDLLQTYVDRFPQGTFAGLARALIRQAEKENAAHREVARRDDEVKRTEEAKAAAERLQREAERKAAESRFAAELKKAQEETTRAREALTAAEREREIALKAAEAARRDREEARKATQIMVAGLPVSSGSDGAQPTDEAALVRGIQKELRRVGCDPGQEDGKWGPDVKGALEKFNRHAKANLRNDAPSGDLLATLSLTKRRVCPLQCKNNEKEVGGACVATVAPRKPVDSAQSSKSASPPAPKEGGLSCLQCCRERLGIPATTCQELCWSRAARIGACAQ